MGHSILMGGLFLLMRSKLFLPACVGGSHFLARYPSLVRLDTEPHLLQKMTPRKTHRKCDSWTSSLPTRTCSYGRGTGRSCAKPIAVHGDASHCLQIDFLSVEQLLWHLAQLILLSSILQTCADLCIKASSEIAGVGVGLGCLGLLGK